MPKSLRTQPWPALKSRFTLRPDEVAELRALYEELPYAAMRAAEALRSDRTFLRGDDLLPFWRADNAVAEIIDRINEILAPNLTASLNPHGEEARMRRLEP